MGTNHQAEQVYLDTIRANTVGGNLATLCNREFSNRIRKQVKEATRQKEQEKQVEHAETLQVQGHLLTLAAKEKQDLLWKSSMFQLKSGTLKFMMNDRKENVERADVGSCNIFRSLPFSDKPNIKLFLVALKSRCHISPYRVTYIIHRHIHYCDIYCNI